MELATEPLPPRPRAAVSSGRGADPWADFLQRVLVTTAPQAEEAEAAAPASEDMPLRATDRVHRPEIAPPAE